MGVGHRAGTERGGHGARCEVGVGSTGLDVEQGAWHRAGQRVAWWGAQLDTKQQQCAVLEERGAGVGAGGLRAGHGVGGWYRARHGAGGRGMRLDVEQWQHRMLGGNGKLPPPLLLGPGGDTPSPSTPTHPQSFLKEIRLN